MKIAIIGGGAAGFFAAISAAEHHPDSEVHLFEKSQKLLAKVAISGGGRCNVTNGTESIKELANGYPRGGKKLKDLFAKFGTRETRQWFESRGVKLYTQEDGRVFPQSNTSKSIIDCLMNEARKKGIKIQSGMAVVGIETGKTFELKFGNDTRMQFNKVILASGGSPKRSGLTWLEAMGHQISDPVPSLFTFNLPRNPITELMGLSVLSVEAFIRGTKFRTGGPLLITHWGLSGPAILELSSRAARELANMNYRFEVGVNWLGGKNYDQVNALIESMVLDHPKRKLSNSRPEEIPSRLWDYLLRKADLDPDSIWADTNKKLRNRLVDTLANDHFTVQGKTTFKEEFVTCGGIALESISMKTMESKVVSGLYFAGEVLDIDGITGGYNFQAAWTTGYIAGRLM